MKPLNVLEYHPDPMLVLESHVPQKACFPVIDAHNHLFNDDVTPEGLLEVMDSVGVSLFINLTGNTMFRFVEEGYSAQPRDISHFIEKYVRKYPKRFACFTMSDFARLDEEVLIKDDSFAEKAKEKLLNDVAKGAVGLKVTKELGLKFKDYRGKFIPIDDKRLDPVWESAGKIGIPILIHTSDPAAFFLPIDGHNEHYPTLLKTPGWGFYGSYFSKEELLAQRNRVIEGHPNTTFICAHVANYPENLRWVSNFLEQYSNAYIDIAARIDELGRQPYSARDFLIKYQDRVLFGTDMPAKPEVYRTYFRFLETRDEYFEPPDYVGRFGYGRWRIYGLSLPNKVLEKIYFKNALRIIPGISI